MFFLLLYSCFYLPPCLPNDMKSPSFGKTNDLVNVSELLLKSSTAVRFCNVTTRRRHKKLEHNRRHGQWTRNFQQASSQAKTSAPHLYILTNCNWCLFPLVVKCSLKPPDRMYLRNSCTIESTLAMAPCSRLVPSLSEPTKRITNGLSTWRSTFHGPYDKQTHKQPNNKNNTNYESPLPENSIFIKNVKV